MDWLIERAGPWLFVLGVIALALGLGLVVYGTMRDPESGLLRAWSRRLARDDADLRFVRAGVSARVFLGAQVALVAGGALAAILLEDVTIVAIGAAVVLVMRLLIARQRRRRIAAIEAQLDTWLASLANAVRSTPSLGDALAVTTEVVRGPIAEETDILLKQTRLGLPLDRALLDLADRIGSPLLASALAALIVGRQTGGNVSAILEESAAGLREMTRLQGALDAKTSESRMQVMVMLGIPFAVVLAIHQIDPGWLEPLSSTSMGIVASAIAAGLWLAAVVLARRILDVSL